jgi:hypothetical protein
VADAEPDDLVGLTALGADGTGGGRTAAPGPAAVEAR